MEWDQLAKPFSLFFFPPICRGLSVGYHKQTERMPIMIVEDFLVPLPGIREMIPSIRTNRHS
jgi:hypothetical protein